MHIGHYIFDSPGPYSNLYTYIEELSNYTESIARQAYQLGQCLSNSHFIIRILVAKVTAEERHPDNKILVTSDSGRFLQEITKQLDFVRIIPGKVVHMDHTANAAFDTYMKSFEDMLLLSKADKIYLLQTGDMYHSGFAKRASMINNKEYEEIRF